MIRPPRPPPPTINVQDGSKLVPSEAWHVEFAHEGTWVYLEVVTEAPNGKMATVISEPVRIEAIPK
ncbi:MAG: hypothetical protein U5K81_04115 [Trueperaceae bacterium]|nr:hypothetical protein [Trueperaceae bacterium]